MKRARTDGELSIASREFEWNDSGLSPVHQLVIPALQRQLARNPARQVLDLGCGNGALTQVLAGWGLQVVGVEPSESGIELARRTKGGAAFVRLDMSQSLPADLRHRFDLVMAVEVIEHLLLPRQLFERAREGLKPGGWLLVTTPYHGYWKNLALAVFNQFDSHWHPLRDFGHVKFFSATTLKALFEEQGFVVRNEQRLGRIPPLACSILVVARMS